MHRGQTVALRADQVDFSADYAQPA